jgi:hypothetical protein
MRAVLAALCVCAWAVAAMGQPIDPSPDGIGIYFDETAREWCATATPGTQVMAYLCLTRASDNSGFLSWEGSVESSVSGVFSSFALRGDAVNAAVAPEFVVSFGTPLPYQVSTVLAEITIDVIWEFSIALRVGPAASPSGADPLPVYTTTAEPGVYKNLQYLWGWDGMTSNWSASINDANCADGPSVDQDDATWSGIKALYR